MKKVTAVLLSLLMIAASGCGMAAGEGSSAGESGISGTWSGTGNNIEGYFTVNVTLENSRIEQVEVEANLPEYLPQNLREEGINAANSVAEQIKQNNAVKADMVSGATVTCQAVLDGASEALVKAGVLKKEDCVAKDGTYSQTILAITT